MTVVIPYCHKDAEAAFSLASIILNQCDLKRHSLMLYAADKDCTPPVGMFPPEVVSFHLSGAAMTHPQGPNDMFAMFCRLVHTGRFEVPRWFFAEADSFPTCANAVNRVEDAHVQAGTLVSGCHVDWLDGKIDTPHHLNGNLVMDREMVMRNPVLCRRVIGAWDCHHAELIMANGADNREIWLPLRKDVIKTTDWWMNSVRPDGHKPAWIHGCRGMACLDRITREGLP